MADKAFARYIKANDAPRHRIVGASYGEAGCLTGDTPVVVRRQHRHTRPTTLENLFRRFNGLADGRSWDTTQPTYLQSLTDSEHLFYNRINGVVESGVQPVVELTFDDGTTLRATHHHPVLTANGFENAADLTMDMSVVGRGSCRSLPVETRQPKADRHAVSVKYHPYGHNHAVTPVNERTRNIRTYYYQAIPRARLVVEAEANNLAYDEYVMILKTDAARSATLRFLPSEFEVHHRDENTLNDRLDNLVVLTKAEHARHHAGRLGALMDATRSKKVTRIQECPPEMTYDVQMAAPAHNFCAANTVVHNSGKTSWWLGAPGPIVVQTLDQGLEGVVENFAKTKDIYVAEYSLAAKPGEQFTHACAVEARDKFVEDFEHAIKVARTIIWDRESDVFPLFSFAEFGTDDPFAAATPKDWDKLKGKLRRLIAMAKASDINFGLIQGMKNEWGSRVNNKTGAKAMAQTGNRVRQGMDDVDALVHINIQHRREAGQFFLDIGKSRGPGSRDIQDQTFQDLSFVEFSQLVFPDSSEEEWL